MTADMQKKKNVNWNNYQRLEYCEIYADIIQPWQHQYNVSKLAKTQQNTTDISLWWILLFYLSPRKKFIKLNATTASNSWIGLIFKLTSQNMRQLKTTIQHSDSLVSSKRAKDVTLSDDWSSKLKLAINTQHALCCRCMSIKKTTLASL
jgi:hypothetical protein